MNLFLICYICVIVVMFFVTLKDFDSFASTPKQVYDCNNFNMFASVLVFVIVFLFNPLIFILKFLWWIFHVGRDGE